MKIWVNGFARDLGSTTLFDHEVRHANTDQPAELRPYQRLKLMNLPRINGVRLETVTSTRLNGQYRMILDVSKKDILCLFLAAYPELRTDLVGTLTGSMAKPTRTPQHTVS